MFLPLFLFKRYSGEVCVCYRVSPHKFHLSTAEETYGFGVHRYIIIVLRGSSIRHIVGDIALSLPQWTKCSWIQSIQRYLYLYLGEHDVRVSGTIGS